jgi:hypothetical protein
VPGYSRHWIGNVKIPALRAKRGLKHRATMSAAWPVDSVLILSGYRGLNTRTM